MHILGYSEAGDETNFKTDEPDISKESGSTATLAFMGMAELGVTGVVWGRREG